MKERSQRKASSRKKSRQALGHSKVGQAPMRKKSRKAARQPSKRITELSQAVEAQRIRAYEQPRLAVAARRVHVVAMGDSWFHYFPAWDILTQLRTKNWGDRLYDVRIPLRRVRHSTKWSTAERSPTHINSFTNIPKQKFLSFRAAATT